MKTCTNMKAIVLISHDPNLEEKIVVGLKWEGDRWGLKGRGATVEDAIAAMANEFYLWLTDGCVDTKPRDVGAGDIDR